MKKTIHIAIALCCLPALAGAQQTPASPDVSNSTVEQITNLQGQIAVLNQQLAVAQLQQKIQQATTGEGPSSPATSSADLAPQPAPAGPLPTLVSIIGSGSHLTATVQLASGGTVIAYPGMPLPGGLTVYDISDDGVRVMDGGNLEELPMASDDTSGTSAETRQNPAFAPQLPGLPMPRFAP